MNSLQDISSNNRNNMQQATDITDIQTNINRDPSCSCNNCISGTNINNNIIPTDTTISSNQNNYEHQTMFVNTSNNCGAINLPDNQQPIFNDTSNSYVSIQNHQQQSMPSNVSTPQFNPQYTNPSLSQSVFPLPNPLGTIIINSPQTNIYYYSTR